MKYLLISPPKKGVKMFIESPPIGLGYLATTLRRLNHFVDLKDCLVENWDNKRLIHYINDTRPHIIGINVFSTALDSVKNLLIEIKKLSFKPMIILGGPHPTGSPKHCLEYFTEADFAFRGEGEIPLIEFDEYLRGKRLLSDVRGLISRNNQIILCNEFVEFPNLDELGFPAWDLINPPKYFDKINVGDKSINVHFSRGCPFNCGFCVKLGIKVRWRSWDHIWKEIEFLHNDYGVKRFLINDEGFTMFPDKVKEFARQSIERGNKYHFFTATGLRLNRVDDEMLQLMNKANFTKSFGVGIESAVPRVREELMNKHLSQDEINRGLEILNRNGFEPVGNFILGYPGETREEVIQTIKWACGNKLLWGANFVPFLPLPGSPIINKMLERGELPEDYDFSKMNLTAVVYAPKGMTIKELDSLRRWGVWKYNFRFKMLKHFLKPEFFVRAVIAFLRIYAPNQLLPKYWKRR